MSSEADAEAFLSLLRPHQRPMEWYARRMLRDPSKTEDVLQEAVLAAFRSFGRFEPGTNFKAWIFRHLTYQILNENRRYEAVHLGEIPVDLTVDEEWERAKGEEAFDRLVEDQEPLLALLDEPLRAALARLAAAERACLLLKSIGEFSYQEIHELLGIPVGSVMGYLSRARRRMRVFLTEQPGPSAAADRAEPDHLGRSRAEGGPK